VRISVPVESHQFASPGDRHARRVAGHVHQLPIGTGLSAVVIQLVVVDFVRLLIACFRDARRLFSDCPAIAVVVERVDDGGFTCRSRRLLLLLLLRRLMMTTLIYSRQWRSACFVEADGRTMKRSVLQRRSSILKVLVVGLSLLGVNVLILSQQPEAWQVTEARNRTSPKKCS
jgi:hypothetical protein